MGGGGHPDFGITQNRGAQILSISRGDAEI